MEDFGQVADVALWPDGVPRRIEDGSQEEITKNGGVMRVGMIHDPELYAFPAPAETNTGAAVVICPGGGYHIVAIEHEGFDVAHWFNTIGVSAFVLKYRLAPYRHPIPLLDAQQAMRIVRDRAEDWGV
ncbi:MAG: alpha/beta hydrolase, partial [Victivallales bacterium]|nr:alpha/beta hydrolase [Victivallales bacterium]